MGKLEPVRGVPGRCRTLGEVERNRKEESEAM